jgi:ribosomal protein S18 acetylase RimI-like enzyme
VIGRDQIARLSTNCCNGRFGRPGNSSTIRAATVADIAAIVTCSDLAFISFACDTDKEDVKPTHYLQSQILEGSIHLICDGACVLGYISLWPIAGQMFIDTLAVLPKHHRQGFGSQLLKFADSETLRLGLKSVSLFTKATIAHNLEFYRRRGYHETGRCDDDGFCRVFYSKNISPVTAATISPSGRRI